jgi:hypothetical protein
MVDAHSKIAIPPETHFLPQVIERSTAMTDPRREIADIIVAGERWPDFEIEETELRNHLLEAPATIPAVVEAFYLLYAERHGKQRWGEKTPTYLFFMAPLEQLFPEARFIHIIRDGRAVAASNIPLSWGPNTVQEAAKWWVQCVEAARLGGQQVRHYLEVRYEHLVANPRPVLEEVCRFLGLDFEEGMLDYHRSAKERLREEQKDVVNPLGGVIRGAEREKIHLHTHRPPDPERITRWQDHWTPIEQLQFEAGAGELLRSLGYL